MPIFHSFPPSPTHLSLTQHLEDTAVYMLNEVYKDKSAIGRSLVKVFLKLDKVVSHDGHMIVTRWSHDVIVCNCLSYHLYSCSLVPRLLVTRLLVTNTGACGPRLYLFSCSLPHVQLEELVHKLIDHEVNMTT